MKPANPLILSEEISAQILQAIENDDAKKLFELVGDIDISKIKIDGLDLAQLAMKHKKLDLFDKLIKRDFSLLLRRDEKGNDLLAQASQAGNGDLHDHLIEKHGFEYRALEAWKNGLLQDTGDFLWDLLHHNKTEASLIRQAFDEVPPNSIHQGFYKIVQESFRLHYLLTVATDSEVLNHLMNIPPLLTYDLEVDKGKKVATFLPRDVLGTGIRFNGESLLNVAKRRGLDQSVEILKDMFEITSEASNKALFLDKYLYPREPRDRPNNYEELKASILPDLNFKPWRDNEDETIYYCFDIPEDGVDNTYHRKGTGFKEKALSEEEIKMVDDRIQSYFAKTDVKIERMSLTTNEVKEVIAGATYNKNLIFIAKAPNATQGGYTREVDEARNKFYGTEYNDVSTRVVALGLINDYVIIHEMLHAVSHLKHPKKYQNKDTPPFYFGEINRDTVMDFAVNCDSNEIVVVNPVDIEAVNEVWHGVKYNFCPSKEYIKAKDVALKYGIEAKGRETLAPAVLNPVKAEAIARGTATLATVVLKPVVDLVVKKFSTPNAKVSPSTGKALGEDNKTKNR
ncbi:MAG: hypothetical protein V4694_00245 [Pseudomonadota bacterium]